MQHLVVFTHSNAEDDRRHVLKAVDPFLAFRPLTSHIEQPVNESRDSSCMRLSTQDSPVTGVSLSSLSDEEQNTNIAT